MALVSHDTWTKCLPDKAKAYSLNQLALPELSIDQRNVPILVKLRTTQLQLVTRLDNSATQPGVRVVQETLQWRQVLLVSWALILLSL